jgi:hypothetical protein
MKLKLRSFSKIGGVLDCVFFYIFSSYRLPKYTKSHVSTALLNTLNEREWSDMGA